MVSGLGAGAVLGATEGHATSWTLRAFFVRQHCSRSPPAYTPHVIALSTGIGLLAVCVGTDTTPGATPGICGGCWGTRCGGTIPVL